MIPEHTNDRDKKLFTWPQTFDNRFNEPRIVFGAEADGLGYDYSDRFPMWDHEKHKAAIAAATDAGHTKSSANWYQAYLSAFFDKPVSLECVLCGLNLSSGYPYLVYGYKTKE